MAVVSGAGGSSDMFLYVKGQRCGIIKGESRDSKHENEIDVVSWSWGMQGKSSLGGGTPSGKSVIHELKIVKRIDSASTPLMSSLRTNELITKAVLTVRKAGKTALEFLKITIEQGRVTSLTVEGGETPTGPEVIERVSFSFNKIAVEYVPQARDGLGGGGTMFMDQFDEQA